MSASAIVKVTLRVHLSQPWSDEEKVGQVIKAASKQAKDTVMRLIRHSTNIEITNPVEVKVIYEEGK